eukprot:Ihof_evm18s11 gene=Ihof_evmTU18s11
MVLPSDDAPVIYGLEYPARSLASQQGQSELIRFYVGTQTLTSENQVHVVEFDDEETQVHSRAYRHSKGEVWDLTSHTTEPNVFSTVYNHSIPNEAGKCGMGIAIWKVPLDETPLGEMVDDEEIYEMEELLDLKGVPSTLAGMLWNPSNTNELVALGEDQIQLWDVNVETMVSKVKKSGGKEGRGGKIFSGGCWNPHHKATQIATATGAAIRGWDLRSMKEVYCIEQAHTQQVRDMDFNPNKQYYMASAGDDNKVKFWDVRNYSQPLLVLHHHTHWVWSVRYNHFHDQLVLSAGSDSQVVLSNVLSLSSDPYGHLDPGMDQDDELFPREQQQDGIIRTYEEHEDSVYVMEW